MSTTNLSRRAILAGAAPVPALALPAVIAFEPAVAAVPAALPVAVPVAASQPDPIVAAIADHRRCYREWSSLCAQLDKAESEIKKHRPIALTVWRNYCVGLSELKRVRDEFLAQPRANVKKIEREYQKAKADCRAKQRAEREWYKRNGLAELEADTDRASGAERQAHSALTTIRPTTVRGAGALVAYVRRDMKDGDDPWQISALANAVRALLAMPDEALPPFAPEAKDLHLSNAVYDVENCDSAIDRLHDKFGDDADSRDDYHGLEDERDVALDVLRSKRARTSNGMVAKARAVSDRRLAEDHKRHGAIATSLANDVLRHFGAEA
jgi:hypothetical protein